MDEKVGWCKMVSLSVRSPEITISGDLHTIGRKERNDTQIKDSKLSATHCIIAREKEKDGTWTYYLEDLSSNGTFHNGKRLGKDTKTLLVDGDEVMLLSNAQVEEKGISVVYRIDTIGFRFVLTRTDNEAKRSKGDPDFIEGLLCGICKNIVHEAITTVPCFHNFCGACYSREKDTKCPVCKKEVDKVNQNKTLAELVEKYLNVISCQYS